MACKVDRKLYDMNCNHDRTSELFHVVGHCVYCIRESWNKRQIGHCQEREAPREGPLA